MKQKTLQNLLLVLVCSISFSALAQKNNGKLELTKGQKLQVDNTLNSVATMEMMGQQMELDVARIARIRLTVLVLAGVRALPSDTIARDSVDIALSRARVLAREF